MIYFGEVKRMHDKISDVVLRIIQDSLEPLETKEIQEKVTSSIKNITRTKLFYRLNLLRGEGLIKGKFVGPGKGVWIWWSEDNFLKKLKRGEK
jgi:repressor of nif and glnA expression